MIQYLLNQWKLILKIGYNPLLPGLERGRTMLLNAIVVGASSMAFLFAIIFKIIDYQYFYGPLYIIPPSILILILNKRKKYKAARYLYALGSLLIFSYWCYEGRRNGNEFTLIGVAITSTLIFKEKAAVYIINFLCASMFILYKIYDYSQPFVPDPAINYNVLPTVILISTVGIITYQMAFFRDLAHHYDKKLSIKYEELNFTLDWLQRTDEELNSSNEELISSNEKLKELTNKLEIIVREKSTELQSYIDAINVNMFSYLIDINGLFIMVNEPLLNVCGYSKQELIGKHYCILTSENHSDAFLREREKHIESGNVWRGEVENKRKDGSYFWFDCVVIPIKGEDDTIKYYLSLGLPITERKMNEQMRENTQMVLETIAFSTSHEIRGPLARIQGLAGLFQKDAISREEFKWVADQIVICSQELNIATTELVGFVNDHYDSIQKDIKVED